MVRKLLLSILPSFLSFSPPHCLRLGNGVTLDPEMDPHVKGGRDNPPTQIPE